MEVAMRENARALVGAVVLLAACAPGAKEAALEPGARHELAHPGPLHEIHVSNPALAVAPDGALHLTWSRRDGTGASVWAWRAGGGVPTRVDPPGTEAAASHDAPGLAIGRDGHVHVLWTSRQSPGSELLLSTSRDGGASFGPPFSVAGAAPRTRDFASLAAPADGVLLAAWLDIEGPRASTRVARVDPAARRVEDESVLETSACVCCRTAVASGPNGAAAVLWRGERAGNVRDMFWARSLDGGRRFAASALVHADGWSLDACPHRGGALAFDGAGRAAAAWYTEGTRAEPSLRLAAADAGAAFGAPRELHGVAGSFPDRVALALSDAGPGVVVFESATAVRREIVARTLAPAAAGLGPTLVLSGALKASGPAATALPAGGFAAAWHEEAFPTLRTIVLELAIRTEVR
jgi:hypothetical protein